MAGGGPDPSYDYEGCVQGHQGAHLNIKEYTLTQELS